MATVVLIRHGRSVANASGTLAGRTPGVDLDDRGREQAAAVGARLARVPLAALVVSPLERCQQTATAVLAQQPEAGPSAIVTEPGLLECDYGTWQGRSLADLAKEPLWRTVQQQPSAATFPDGESLAGMQSRAVAAVRAHDAQISGEVGPHAVWAAVSHGDIIATVLADALGMHLDMYQRLGVQPASVSVIHYGPQRPQVLGVNTLAGDLDWLVAPPRAAVGGSTGP